MVEWQKGTRECSVSALVISIYAMYLLLNLITLRKARVTEHIKLCSSFSRWCWVKESRWKGYFYFYDNLSSLNILMGKSTFKIFLKRRLKGPHMIQAFSHL